MFRLHIASAIGSVFDFNYVCVNVKPGLLREIRPLCFSRKLTNHSGGSGQGLLVANKLFSQIKTAKIVPSKPDSVLPLLTLQDQQNDIDEEKRKLFEAFEMLEDIRCVRIRCNFCWSSLDFKAKKFPFPFCCCFSVRVSVCLLFFAFFLISYFL